MKKFLLASLLLLLCLEATCRLLVRSGALTFNFAELSGKTIGRFIYDPFLGWKNRPGYRAMIRWYPGATPSLLAINPQGLRSEDSAADMRPGQSVIAAIGSSYTYGSGVANGQTYPDRLQELTAGKARVLNFGTAGYGLDQSVLNYIHNVRKYRPGIVLLEISPLSVEWSLYTSTSGARKPAYVLQGGKLILRNYPVSRNMFQPLNAFLSDNSVFFRLLKDRLLKFEARKNIAGNAIRDEQNRELFCGILKLLKAEVKADKAVLIAFVWDDPDGSLRKLCLDSGIETVSIVGVREDASLMGPPPFSHWSEQGNRYVADVLFRYLEEKHPGIISPATSR